MTEVKKALEYKLLFFATPTNHFASEWLDEDTYQAYMAAIRVYANSEYGGLPWMNIGTFDRPFFVALDKMLGMTLETRDTGSQIHTDKPQVGKPKVIAAADSKDIGEKEIMN